VNDIETLVRETLTDPRRRLDPDPQHYERVRGRARVLRRQRAGWWTAGAAAVAAAAVVIAISAVPSGNRPRPLGRPAPTRVATPLGVIDPLINFPTGVTDVAVGPTSAYLLLSSPPSVVRLALPGHGVQATGSAPASADGLSLDPTANLLWVWSTAADGRMTVGEYDATSLTLRQTATIPTGQAFSAVAMGGELWLTSPAGLYRVTGTGTVTQVPGLTGVFGLAADRGRNRILAGVDNTQLVAVDPSTLQVTRGGPIDVGKDSVAVVDGQIWVGGYGSGTGDRLRRYDPVTLKPVGTSEVNQQLGPGAVVWPGTGVIWVRDGGDEGLSCLDPVDGRILQQWREVQGPVASVTGNAMAAHNGQAVRLPLNQTCRG
jgi:hypothetical protein